MKLLILQTVMKKVKKVRFYYYLKRQFRPYKFLSVCFIFFRLYAMRCKNVNVNNTVDTLILSCN